ncbi:hypothetical protein GO986_00970 [Deinococcus sp. HMF7620]|uniref:Rhodanese domain-containing protein n=1 Tax=Deinococcus arboris TaxID=2682977 RepID=A0A7C9LJV5_9DEIO|nr:hypothetical protein [Deinococcus arboris]MVN85337.1 hypothetical protein [Deinococcus arboris]
MRLPVLLIFSLLTLNAVSAAAAPTKAQQIAVFKVAALARANVTDTALRATGVPAETVTIAADYLYGRDLNVQAYDLDAFLKARIPNIETLAQSGAQILFWCRDGYAPTAKLSDVLGQGGLIAVRDADAPEAVGWSDVPYKTSLLTAADVGNYVVWRTAQFPAKPQPWGLETVYILPANAVIK